MAAMEERPYLTEMEPVEHCTRIPTLETQLNSWVTFGMAHHISESQFSHFKSKRRGDVPGSPVTGVPNFHFRGCGFDPCKIPHVKECAKILLKNKTIISDVDQARLSQH